MERLKVTFADREGKGRRIPAFAAPFAVLLALLVPACVSPARTEPPLPGEAVRLVSDAESHQRAGRTEEARAALEAALALAPRSIDIHRRLQMIRLAAQEHEALALEYQQRLDEAPDDPTFIYLRGRLHFRTAEQAESFERARKADPHAYWPRWGIAKVRQSLGDLYIARREAIALADDHPAAPEPRFLAGEILRAENRPEEAAAWYRAGLAIEGASAAGLSGLGLALLDVGEEAEALHVLARGALADPGDAAALVELVRAVRRSPRSTAGWILDSVVETLGRTAPRRPDVALLAAEVALSRGDAASAASKLREAVEDGADPHATGLRRRLVLVRLGRYREAFEAWDIPAIRALRTREENLLRDRHEAVHRAAQAAESSGDPRDLETLARAMARAGWIEEAIAVAAGPLAGVPSAAPLLDELLVFRRAVATLDSVFAGLVARAKKGERTPDLRETVTAILSALAEIPGVPKLSGGRIVTVPLIGAMLDPSDDKPEGLSAWFGRWNHGLLVGQFAGRPPEAVLCPLVARWPVRADAGGGRMFAAEGWAGEDLRITVENGSTEGEVGGRALWRMFFLDLDVLLRWDHALRRAADLPEPIVTRLLGERGLPASGPEELRSVDEPLASARKLLVRALREDPSSALLVDTVAAHEIGHLADAERRLPILGDPLRNLFIAINGGFTARGVLTFLEEEAQRWAIEHGPSPHLALFQLVAGLPQGESESPHGVGYRRLLRRFLRELDLRLADHPALDRRTRLLHRIHVLEAGEIRRLAGAL